MVQPLIAVLIEEILETLTSGSIAKYVTVYGQSHYNTLW